MDGTFFEHLVPRKKRNGGRCADFRICKARVSGKYDGYGAPAFSRVGERVCNTLAKTDGGCYIEVLEERELHFLGVVDR
jgi:hypothetical protein